MSYYYIILKITGDEDYTSGPYTAIFTAGVTTASLSIPINDDNVLEEDEYFRLMIDPTSLPDDVTVGSPRSVVLVIRDDDGK